MSNKFTGAFHEAVQIVYNRLGGHAAFLEWARKNRTEYYRIAARLIPGEMQDGNGERSIRVIVYGSQPAVDVRPALPDHSTSEVENVEAS